MYHDSTQKSHWLFQYRQQLTRIRAETNANYCKKYSDIAISEGCQFLTASEENFFSLYYMKKLFEFCNQFNPPVSTSVLGTAAAYFKRFYLYTSVMDYHPSDIFLCCAYLAFKIEEYNVSIDEFVYVLANELRESVAETVLTNELLMLKKLKFHLIVHTPFRALEGFNIDIKARSSISNPELHLLRKEADNFLLKSLYSDVGLLHPPSQIALASLQHASRLHNIDITGYIETQLLNELTKENYSKFIQTMQNIIDTVNNVSIPESSQELAHIEKRLQTCKRQNLTSQLSMKRKKEEEEPGYYGNAKRSKVEQGEEPIVLHPLSGFGQLK